MSAYPPPNENLPIFNPLDFQRPNIPLTIDDAKDYFLEYPTAQGEETLSSIIVNGASTFNDTAGINDTLTINQPTSTLNSLSLINDNPGYSITATARTNPGTAGVFTLSSSSLNGKENVVVDTGDCVLAGGITDTTGALTLVPRNQQRGQGIRLQYDENQLYGITKLLNGGTSTDPAGNNGELVFPDGTSQTTAFNSSLYAPLNSPAFTGNPTAPTQSQGDNSTKLATTNYVDTAVGGGGSVHYTYSELIVFNGTAGSFINITIPAGTIKCDVMTFGRGGAAGQTNAFGSYAVNGGSGGGASMVCAYGVPINSNSTLQFYWNSGYGQSGNAYVMLNNGTGSPSGLPLGTAYNGEDGGAGQSSGSGTAGQAGGTPAYQPLFPSSKFDGTAGLAGGSLAFPNSFVPVGGSQPTRGGREEYIDGKNGGPGMGQRYSAFNQAGYQPYWYSASSHIDTGSVRITWYITQ
jgi:hypothetical protein